MIFSSALFILAFLPLFLIAYYLAPFRFRSPVILAGSYIFYAWWRVDFLALLVAVTAWSFLVGLRLEAARDERTRWRWCAAGVAVNLSVLGYFKYVGFFAGAVSDTFLGGAPLSPVFEGVILPIGISFYVFQAISYVIDVYRRDAPPARRLVDFAAFIALFPQLIAGPVLRYKDLADQFEHREHSLDRFGEGARRFFIGLAKKVLIADTVAPLADTMFALSEPTLAEAWLGALAYTVQLYFDFSGYSDMAIGLGLMMGFRFIENFRQPYVSRSITEFWRRWHISLSAWLRDYLYIPLGGNRHGTARTYANLVATMVLGGLWHGANWTFVAWGAWHGALLATERALGVRGDSRPPAWAWAPTMLGVIIGWVLFRSLDLGGALSMLGAMAGANGLAGISDEVAWRVGRLSLLALVVGGALALLEPRLVGRRLSYGRLVEAPRAPSVARAAAVSIVGMVAMTKLLADTDSPFLYFQF